MAARANKSNTVGPAMIHRISILLSLIPTAAFLISHARLAACDLPRQGVSALSSSAAFALASRRYGTSLNVGPKRKPQHFVPFPQPPCAPFSHLLDERKAAHPHDVSLAVASDAEKEETAYAETEGVEVASPRGQLRTNLHMLSQASIIGALSGLCVAIFKASIDAVRQLGYGTSIGKSVPRVLIPTLGGLAVSFLSLAGDFSPGLRGTVAEVDGMTIGSEGDGRNEKEKKKENPLRSLRKTLGAVFTLGTGNSLGPEGPSVEIGMVMSRIGMNLKPFFGPNDLSTEDKVQRNRLLLSCGAAAGVSAGFNAPIAGVFFALEIVQAALPPLKISEIPKKKDNGGEAKSMTDQPITSGAISAILLSSVISALVSRLLLGNHLHLKLSQYTITHPLVDLPLYLLLGALSGIVAVAFSQTAKFSESMFDGEVGPNSLRAAFLSIPKSFRPVLGGLMCGLVGLARPQVLFFGYDTLNSLLANESLPTAFALALLASKMLATAIAAGSGLVGGTFAPSLLLGAMVGASFHNAMAGAFRSLDGVLGAALGGPVLVLADVPAFTMVGAASVLAALFRAPLTASLLLFELTRDYDVLLPLMASAGVGSLLADIVENKVEFSRMKKQRRDMDSVSWGDLASKV